MRQKWTQKLVGDLKTLKIFKAKQLQLQEIVDKGWDYLFKDTIIN